MSNRVPVAMVHIPEIHPTPFPGEHGLLNFESSDIYQVSTPLINRYKQQDRSMTGLR